MLFQNASLRKTDALYTNFVLSTAFEGNHSNKEKDSREI
ncbi:hypothetical protein LCGC14_2449640, partial [marine sediment metagenome]